MILTSSLQVYIREFRSSFLCSTETNVGQKCGQTSVLKLNNSFFFFSVSYSTFKAGYMKSDKRFECRDVGS